MCKKMIYLTFFVLVIGLPLCKQEAARAADTNLVGWWKFDDGSGTFVEDSSGYGNDGTIINNPNPQWVTGQRNGALQLDGTDDYVSLPIGSIIPTLSECTFSIWVNWAGRPDPTVGGWQRIIDFGSGTTSYIYLCPSTGAANASMRLAITAGNSVWDEFDASTGALATGWHHLAITVSESSRTMILYLDGNAVGSKTNCINSINDLGNTSQNWLGRSQYTPPSVAAPGDPYYNGSLDDFQIYNRVLSQAEVRKVANPEKASVPQPADREILNVPELTLQWQSGTYAAQHDVYFGENQDSVNNATISSLDIYKGHQGANSYPVTDLTAGTTYYWRIDEVNDLHPAKIWKGAVWSFRIQPMIAYEPNPSDGAKYVNPSTSLSWTSGAKAKRHDVYLGTSLQNVSSATRTNKLGVLVKQDNTTNTYKPTSLQPNTTYYWRIDEVNSPNFWTGDIWSFQTMPRIAIIDPNLVGWWKFDEGEGMLAADWSGRYNQGTLTNGPLWVYGYDGDAIQLDGTDDYVSLPVGSTIAQLSSATFAIWVNWAGTDPNWQHIFNFGTGTQNYMYLSANTGTAPKPMYVAITTNGSAAESTLNAQSTLGTGWHHAAVVFEPGNIQLYLDAQSVGSTSTTYVLSDLGVTTDNWLGRSEWPNDAYFNGSLDEFRIYNRVLSQDEISKIMRGDPLLAWNPRPANRAITDVEKTLSLSWSPGEKASKHDVYFGTDADAVGNANTFDNTGIYRGRQDANSYTLPNGVEPNQAYYWRIDEFNTDSTISKGRTWSFNVAPYLIVDDFENYNDVDNRIYLTWEDYATNNTGMTVGHFVPPYAERSIVHNGSQSMYMRYDNDGTVNEGIVIEGFNYEQSGTLFYSEAQRQWTEPQDWTRKGVNSLTIWFRGVPASVGSFTAGPPIIMTADGADIWGTADQFHFAYKQLSGNVSITARVVSLTNTDPWAKAGVMIRETLDAGSKHAMVIVSPGNGVAFQYRIETGGASAQEAQQTGITAPQWVRLSRQGNTFTADYSSNGNNWTPLGSALDMPMLADAYVGLCLTSRIVNAACIAEFSNVNPAVTNEWKSQDIGIESNIAEPMYVVLEDSTGNSVLVKYPDPAATAIGSWTQWNIPFSELTGVKLQSITKLSIGVGDRASTQPGSAGNLYIDDIGLLLP